MVSDLNQYLSILSTNQFSLMDKFPFSETFLYIWQTDKRTHSLDLSDNDLGPLGISYIAEMLAANKTLIELVSQNLGISRWVTPQSPLLDTLFFIDLKATVGTYELRSYGSEP